MSPDATSAQPSPPPFGSAYARSRKAYGVASAILLAWELVGIEIDGNPIATLNISLKSPQAAPYVLLVLVLYFAFHFTVEWYQGDLSRRLLRASRVDFVAAHVIGASALGLFLVQTFLRVQVANVVPRRVVLSLMVGLFYSLSVVVALRLWRERDRWLAILMLAATIALIIGTASRQRTIPPMAYVALVAAGIVTGSLFITALVRWATRPPRSK